MTIKNGIAKICPGDQGVILLYHWSGTAADPATPPFVISLRSSSTCTPKQCVEPGRQRGQRGHLRLLLV